MNAREDAEFYDLNPNLPHDLPFYQTLIPSSDCSVLELGCGTGRLTIPLAACCHSIYGLDASLGMVGVCRKKLGALNIPERRATVNLGDASDFGLGMKFDLIIGPFHLLQYLTTDAEIDGLFGCVREHLAPGGTAVLNIFRIFLTPAEVQTRWLLWGEQAVWEAPVDGGKVVCYERHIGASRQPLILYPQFVYRHWEGENLVDEAVVQLAMRCYYPREFEELIMAHGFQILNRWGGYSGETFGVGPELVLQFGL